MHGGTTCTRLRQHGKWLKHAYWLNSSVLLNFVLTAHIRLAYHQPVPVISRVSCIHSFLFPWLPLPHNVFVRLCLLFFCFGFRLIFFYLISHFLSFMLILQFSRVESYIGRFPPEICEQNGRQLRTHDLVFRHMNFPICCVKMKRLRSVNEKWWPD